MITAPGIYQMSMDEYQADPCPEPSLSSGLLHTMETKSDAHAYSKHPKLGNEPREESDTLNYGSACHDMLLEGSGKLVVVDAADWRTKDAKEQRAAAKAAGKLPVLSHQADKLQRMFNVAQSAILAATDFDPSDWLTGASEQTLIWQEGGVWHRARVDRLPKDRCILFDYKSTKGSANPASWQRQAWALGYDLQAVHYMAGNRATGGPDCDWIWLVQECIAPFACSWVSPSPAAIEYATTRRKRLIARWRECLDTGEWAGYPNKIAYIEPPSYAIAQWEERALMDEAEALQ